MSKQRYSKKFETGFETNVSNIFGESKELVDTLHRQKVTIQELDNSKFTIKERLEETLHQLKLMGYKERTMSDYKYHIERYMKITEVNLISEMDKDSLLLYINHNNVSRSTMRIRLKLMKAVLNKWYSEGIIQHDFWSEIRIKVNEEVKIGASQDEIETLLGSLDFNNFTELRDGTMFLLMWETGARLGTICQVTYKMLDLDAKLICYSGESMKNYKYLTLPISDRLKIMLSTLKKVNREVLEYNQVRIGTGHVFLSSLANPMESRAFSKRVKYYKERTGLENINPHAIRRGFAKRLLDNGLSVPLISKALNHKSIETTTRYLHIDNHELLDAMRGIE